MLVTLGTLRHALSSEYDLQDNVRQFVRRLARQQGLAWARPAAHRRRLFAGASRIQRTLEFMEFIEGQEAFIVEAQSSLFGFRHRIRRIRRRLVSLGVAVLLVGGALYFVLAYPRETREMTPSDLPFYRSCTAGCWHCSSSSSSSSSRTCVAWATTASHDPRN